MALAGLTAQGVPAAHRTLLLRLRIAIVVLSVVVLSLAAYALSLFGSFGRYLGGYTGVSGLLIFVAILTWLVLGALWLAEFRLPQYYYRVIALGAFALVLIFWLSAWAWAASMASFWLGEVCGGGFGGGFCDDDDYAKKEGRALAACAGLGALVWILFIVQTALFVRACLCEPTPAAPQAELGPVGGKVDATTDAAAVPYQQPPVYGQPSAYP